MAPRKQKISSHKVAPQKSSQSRRGFVCEFKNDTQGLAWAAFQQHDVLFLMGPAGTGKTFLACAFAVEQILSKQKKKIILTRPIVEAGESLGYLPGEFEDKIHPYMVPMFDCLDKLVGKQCEERDFIMKHVECVPLAFMRGRTFDNAVCILDESQNASKMQIKMFLTRFGENSKIIVTGDPEQSDLGGPVALKEVVQKLVPDVHGIGLVKFGANSIVRHPLVGKIIEKLEG